MQKEIWKDIPNYEGYYQVSNLGRVKSLDRILIYSNGRKHKQKGIVLTQSMSNNNYLTVTLKKNNKGKTKTVHSLVGEVFIGKLKNRNFVYHHIDGRKTNNRLNNLEIVTNRYNTTEYKGEYVGVSFNSDSKCWISSIRHNGKQIYLGRFKNKSEAKEYYNDALKSIKENKPINKKVRRVFDKYTGVYKDEKCSKNPWYFRFSFKKRIYRSKNFPTKEMAAKEMAAKRLSLQL